MELIMIGFALRQRVILVAIQFGQYGGTLEQLQLLQLQQDILPVNGIMLVEYGQQ
jgi:hypothetical protein